MKAQSKHTSDVPVVLLDGSCSHCHEWKETLQRRSPPGTFRYISHRTDPLEEGDLPPGACTEPLAVVEPDGRTATGMEAIVRVLRLSTLGKLAMLYYVPGIRRAADRWLLKRSQERCKFARQKPRPETAPW